MTKDATGATAFEPAAPSATGWRFRCFYKVGFGSGKGKRLKVEPPTGHARPRLHNRAGAPEQRSGIVEKDKCLPQCLLRGGAGCASSASNETGGPINGVLMGAAAPTTMTIELPPGFMTGLASSLKLFITHILPDGSN